MNDKDLHNIFNSLDGIKKAEPPEYFGHKVMNRWYATVATEPLLMRYRYWAAASLIGFTMLNGLALYSLNMNTEGTESISVDTATEKQFTEAYKLVKTSDYYTFNDTQNETTP